MKKIYTLIIVTVLLSLNINGQTFLWAKQMGGTSVDNGYAVAVDALGNAYTTGRFIGTSDFDPGAGVFNLTSVGAFDIFVSKLDASGNFVWAKHIGGAAGSDEGFGITVDASGNVYTTGYFSGTVDFDPGAGTFNLTAFTESVFVSKLDVSGNFVWAQQMGLGGYARGHSIVTDGSGNVYTTGNFDGTADFDPGAGVFNLISTNPSKDIFVSKLNTSGNFVWAKAMGGTAVDEGNSIAVDGSGNVYTTGYFQNTPDFDPGAGVFNLFSAGADDAFVSKLDISGNFVWATQFGASSTERGTSIAIDGSGNVLTTGYFNGASIDFDPGAATFFLSSLGNHDVFISKLTTAGNFVWAKQLGGTNFDFGYSLSVDGSGNVYTTGSFNSTADFDPGAGVYNLSSLGGTDIFVSKLNPSGNFVWALSMGGTISEEAKSISIDVSGNIYTTGLFQGTCDFDPGAGVFNLTPFGSQEIFVHKIAACVSAPSTPGTISGATTICSGSSNTYSITPVGGATSYTWTLPGGWTGTSTTNSISATASTTSGNITVTANNACGFSTAQTLAVTVSNPILTVSPNSASCFGNCDGSITAIASGGIAPYTYTPSLTNLCAATYTVVVTDNIGCISTQSTTVGQPTAISASATATPGTICSGNCSTLSIGTITGGTAPYIYNWQPGNLSGSSVTVCPTTTSCYTLTVTDASGCTTTALVCVTVNQLPNIVVTGGGIVCEGTNVCFGSTGGLSYSWSGPCGFTSTQQNPCITSIGATCGGTFTVTGTDVNGCSNTATVALVVNPLPTVTYNETQTTTCVNWNPITLSAGSPLGGTYSGTAVTGNSFAPATAGAGTFTITYTYTDANACANSSTSQIVVDLCLGIQPVNYGSTFDVFPNPFSNVFTVQCGSESINGELKIYDVLGQEIFSSVISKEKTEIDLSGFPDGIYFLKIISKETIVTKQIIKQ